MYGKSSISIIYITLSVWFLLKPSEVANRSCFIIIPNSIVNHLFTLHTYVEIHGKNAGPYKIARHGCPLDSSSSLKFLEEHYKTLFFSWQIVGKKVRFVIPKRIYEITKSETFHDKDHKFFKMTKINRFLVNTTEINIVLDGKCGIITSYLPSQGTTHCRFTTQRFFTFSYSSLFTDYIGNVPSAFHY